MVRRLAFPAPPFPPLAPWYGLVGVGGDRGGWCVELPLDGGVVLGGAARAHASPSQAVFPMT